MFKQITVFLENKPGRMEKVTGCLADNNINLHALSIADTSDFGILRVVVSDSDKAIAVLKAENYMVKITDVAAIPLGRSPGSLHKVLRELKRLDISIEYMYAFTSRHKDCEAIVILRFSEQENAVAKLKDSGFPLLDSNIVDELE